MHFELTQRFTADVADVDDALSDPAYYAVLTDSPKLGTPEVLSREADGPIVRMRIRYRFSGDLSSAVRAVVDPAKLTWIEESTHDSGAHAVTFVLRPDHYADRLTASGSYRLQAGADGSGTVRVVAGDVKVRAPLVAGAVERAIISGLDEHLQEEVGRMARWLDQS